MNNMKNYPQRKKQKVNFYLFSDLTAYIVSPFCKQLGSQYCVIKQLLNVLYFLKYKHFTETDDNSISMELMECIH